MVNVAQIRSLYLCIYIKTWQPALNFRGIYSVFQMELIHTVEDTLETFVTSVEGEGFNT